MEQVTAEEIERTRFPTSPRGYDTSEVDSFLKTVAEAVRAHEQAYQKLGQEVGDVLQQATGSANKFLSDAKAEAASIREKALADAARAAQEVEAEVTRLRQQAEREAQKTRRAAEREATKRIKEAELRVRHLERLEKESRERLGLLQREVVNLGETIERLEPVHPESDEDFDETTDDDTSAELDAESPQTGGPPQPEVVSAVGSTPAADESPTAPGPEADRVQDAGPVRVGQAHGPAPDGGASLKTSTAASEVKVDGWGQGSTPSAGPETPVAGTATATSTTWPPVTPPTQTHELSPAALAPATPGPAADEPLKSYVAWAALAAVAGLFGIVGFLIGLIVTLVDQGGLLGPLLALVSIGALAVSGWVVKTQIGPALSGVFGSPGKMVDAKRIAQTRPG